MTATPEPCRRRGCSRIATSGSWVWRDRVDGAPAPWLWTLLCEPCGVEATKRGARPYRHRPRAGQAVRGVIADDLRRAGTLWWRHEHPESTRVWIGARLSLGLPEHKPMDELDTFAPDTASEAIEAAEALDL